MRPAFALATLTAIAYSTSRTLDLTDPRWEGFDAHRYVAASQGALVRARGHRPAAPLLASVLGWQALAVASLVACAALLYKWLRNEGIAELQASIATLLFVLARPVQAIGWNVYQAADAIGLAALIGALCCVQRRAWRAFVAVACVGCLARETPVLAVPVALLAGPWWTAAPVLVVLALRQLPHDGGYTLAGALVMFAPLKFSPDMLARAALTFAPAIALFRRPRHALLLAGVAATYVLGYDVERLLLPAAPVVYLAAAETMGGWPRWALGTVVACGVVAALHHEVGAVLGRWGWRWGRAGLLALFVLAFGAMHADDCPPETFTAASCACGFTARFVATARPEAACIPATYRVDLERLDVSCPCFFCGGPAHPATGCQYSERVIACRACTERFWTWARGMFGMRRRVGRDKNGHLHADFYAAAGKFQR